MADSHPSQSYPRFAASLSANKRSGGDPPTGRDASEADRRAAIRTASDLPIKLRITPTAWPEAPARYIPGRLVNHSETGTLVEFDHASPILDPHNPEQAAYALAIARDPRAVILAHADMKPVRIVRSARIENKLLLALRFLSESDTPTHITPADIAPPSRPAPRGEQTQNTAA